MRELFSLGGRGRGFLPLGAPSDLGFRVLSLGLLPIELSSLSNGESHWHWLGAAWVMPFALSFNAHIILNLSDPADQNRKGSL